MKDIDLIRAMLGRLSIGELRELSTDLSSRLDGDPIEASPLQTGSIEVPGLGLCIEFRESTAGNFSRALATAKTASSYVTYKDQKAIWHRASWRTVDLVAAMPLVEQLSGLRNRRCFIDGVETHWADVFSFSPCASERARSYRPDHYCFGGDEQQINPWGCVHARMDWTEWVRWFSYGRFENSGSWLGNRVVWRFDKDRIRHEVSTNIYKVKYCPHLNFDLVEAVLSELPDTVEISAEGQWKYSQNYEQVPGAIKVVEKQQFDGYVQTNEYFADGVRPRGQEALKDVVQRAFARLGKQPPAAIRQLR